MKLFEIFDKINNTNLNESFLIKRRMFEHENNVNLFSQNLNEGDDIKREQAIDALKNNNLETTPQEFYDSLMKSKHPDMLTSYTISDLSSMKLFKVPNLNIGYAIKKFKDKGFKELVAVHNNEPDVPNIGTELINSAIRNDGLYIDHYDGFLSPFHKRMGYVEYKRDSFDPQYDIGGKFAKKYGKQDIIYRKHKSCN